MRQGTKLIASIAFFTTLSTAVAQPQQRSLPPLPPGLSPATPRVPPGTKTEPVAQPPASQMTPGALTNSLLNPLVRQPVIVSPSPARLMADADLKEYTAKPGETNAHFTFNLTNVSSAPVLISFVRTSCGCT